MTTSTDTPEDIADDIDELLTWINEGEFGGSTAGGGVFAPSGRRKAGIAPLGIFFLFQK